MALPAIVKKSGARVDFDPAKLRGSMTLALRKRQVSIEQIDAAIERIQAARGLAVLAHPIQLRAQNDAQLEQTIKSLVDQGLNGLEVIHSDHTAADVDKFTKLADKYNLLKTGGSDFHGSNKKDIQLGAANGRQIPRAFFDALIAHQMKPRV